MRAAQRRGVLLRGVAVEQGLCQGCLLVPLLLFNIFFVVVIKGAYAYLKVDEDIMDASV